MHIVVVGAGLFGATVARRIVDESNHTVEVIELRNRVGGNCYDYLENGSYIHKYGSHIFHTNSRLIWDFVNRFSSFVEYRHSAVAIANGIPYSFPINLNTLNQVFKFVETELDARNLLTSFKSNVKPRNFEEAAISALGNELYNLFFKGYTTKQWGIDPKLLPSSIFHRLPIHFDNDDSYFKDSYQGLPIDGYTNLIHKIMDHQRIAVKLESDFRDIMGNYLNKEIVIYSGPLDYLFDYKYGLLPWRSLDFQLEYLRDENFQPKPIVNYCDVNVPYTRIHEFNLYPNSKYFNGVRTLMKEFPKEYKIGDERFYPVNTNESRLVYAKYMSEVSQISNFYVGGRLGAFKYFDMDMTIANAFVVASKILSHSDPKL